MYLSKLEIIGFKSFADKTTLTFHDGLSAIVGPNGSGKTNFVDAIRWVLGEQKTSILRSESMENVIFNGSKNRKPLGLSEVSITIMNNKKILPTDYDEINISRRLFKDGESQYLINKVPARLKDINNLFMDTGLGADSYSVIELKMIENILNGNTNERREIFEEASGIKKFKLNKKDATKKLHNVELDIERINDIITEVQKNVNSLSRQAAKTKRYNTLINELKEIEVNFFIYEILIGQYNLEQKNVSYLNLSKNLEIGENEVKSIEQFQLELKDKYNKTDEEFQELTKQEISTNNALSNLNNDLKLNEEKSINLKSLNSSLVNEIADSDKYIERNSTNIENLKKEFVELKLNIEEKSNALNELKTTGAKIREIYLDKQKQLDLSTQKIKDLNQQKSFINSSIAKSKNLIDRLKIRINEEQNKLNQLNKQIFDNTTNKDTLKIDFNELEKIIVEKKNNLANLIELKSQSEKLIEDYRHTELELRNLLNQKQTEKNFLENIAISDNTIKTLLNSKTWSPKAEKLLLGEIINIDEKFNKAITIAMENVLSSFLIEDTRDINSAISDLRLNKQGWANFAINLNKLQLDKKEITKLNSEGILGWLSELISTNDKYKQLIENLSANILVVDNFDNAIKIMVNPESKNFGIEKIVTLDGILIDKSGLVRGGGEAATYKSIMIGRRNKIQLLNEQIDKIKQELINIQEKLKTEQNKIWQFAIPDKESEVKQLENKFNTIRQEILRLENKIEFTNNSKQATENNLNLINAELAEKLNEETTGFDEISSIDENLVQLLNQQNLHQNDFNQVKLQLENNQMELRNLEIEIARQNERQKHTESEINKLIALTENAKKQLIYKQNDLEKNKLVLEQLSENHSKFENNISTIKNDLLLIIEQKNIKQQERKNLQEQLTQYEITLDTARKQYQKILNDIHSIEIELTSIKTKLQSVIEQSNEQYQIDILSTIQEKQVTLEHFTDFDSAEEKNKIHQHKEKISSLGNVNFQALEDYEEQKKRLDFLLTQMNDLQKSRETLNETIAEINKVAIEKFTTTFEQVKTNFKNLFKVLFGEEAEADLALDGDSVLDSDVIITAKPPFKKPASIDSLSAGEKTLTAIALLFSIYLVKPSPFCILDEVDAPLDDSNINKFITLIKKFSNDKQIQFILITHNKKTMEAADLLYGLTMEEEGVTKIVSVKLEK